jgi:Ca-activated chloride channel homolog
MPETIGNMNAVSRLLKSFFIVAGLAVTLSAADPVPTIIVLDASGSMRERIKGESKMVIAKRAIKELVESLPDGANVGLVVYSHRKSNDCDDIEQLIAPGRLDKADFIAAV